MSVCFKSFDVWYLKRPEWGIEKWNKGNYRNAGNQGGNVGNQGGNAGNGGGNGRNLGWSAGNEANRGGNAGNLGKILLFKKVAIFK